MTFLQKVKEIQSQIDALQKEIKQVGKDAAKEGFEQFFEAHPTIKKISWRQVGPDMSDGDYSPASVWNDDFDVVTTDGGEYEEVYSGYAGENEPKEVTAAVKAFKKLLDAISDNVLFSLYGEDVRVTAHSGGRVTKEEYYRY